MAVEPGLTRAGPRPDGHAGLGADPEPGLGRPGRRGAWLNALGLILVGAAVAWTWFSAGRAGGDAGSPVVLILGCAAAFVAAREVGRSRPGAIPGLLVAVAAILLVADLPGILRGGPIGGPFGYQNATGAFFFQASVAGLMLAILVPRALVVGLLAAVVFAAVPLVSGSITAGVLVVSLPVWVVARRPDRARAAVTTCGVLVLTALVLTAALGAVYRPGDRSEPLDRLADATLTEQRLVLWREALDLMASEPLTGVGPGRFEQVSPTARSSLEVRWAHHGFLQQGAETGLPGLALLVLLFAWGFARLRSAGPPSALVGLGAVALAGLGIHATVDYVLHFPAIPLAAAALVGAATIPVPGETHGNEDTHT